MSAAVSFRGVGKRYGAVTALSEVSLDIARGELLSLLGPSGSGKSTLLMLLAGLEAPTSGDVLLDGRSLNGVPANRRNLGMVFQRYTLFPHMTVAQNVAFPLDVRRVPAAERDRRVAAVLATVQLGGLGDRLPRQLSGGQQQRVALARALVYDPPVLLMDEPFAALDRKLRVEMQDEIRRLRRELGLTIVFVTHDQEEAMRLSNRIAVMSEGRLEQVGDARALYEKPATPFVAGFVGSVNFLDTEVVGTDARGIALRIGGGPTFSLPREERPPTAPGRRCRLAVRPEALVLRPADDPVGSIAVGTVADVVFLGEHSTATVTLPGGGQVEVWLSADESVPAVGARCALALRAGAARLFEAAA